MAACVWCGSIGQGSRVCGICGRSPGIVSGDPSRPSGGASVGGKETLNRRRSKRFWTTTRILVSSIVVLVAISSIAAGAYYSPPRASTPSCTNGAVNYASCDSCGSLATYNTSRQACFCTNGGRNPPSCNNFCANNAINPPNCDWCPDNHSVDLGVVCPPQPPEETLSWLSATLLDSWHSLAHEPRA